MNRSSCDLPWFKKWFNESYLLLYRHRDLRDARQQIKLIIDTINPDQGSPILDLGCGDGRHMHLLGQQGYNVFGLDLSEKLLRAGKKNHGPLNVILGDMRHIPGKFHLILSLFTSFGYFNSTTCDMQVIESVSQALSPGGWFWLDFLSPDYIKTHLDRETSSFIDDQYRVTEKRRITNNRIVKDISFSRDKQKWEYQESVRLYDRWELEAMLKQMDIIPAGCFGNYEGQEWSDHSPRTIIYGKKIE